MNIQEILHNTKHRLWPLPEGNWKYYQEWNNVIFLHWEVKESELEMFIPDNIEIDYFNGTTWVSLVAFTMQKTRPRNLPYLPPISNFHEINIRTYVKYKGKSGVYFLSIEANSKISCWLARKMSNLPYRFSQMGRMHNSFTSRNEESKYRLNLNYSIEQKMSDKSDLDNWLTERYALFQDTKNGINTFDIHHMEWPIFNVKLNQIDIHYQHLSNLINLNPNKYHYSPGVQILAWENNKY